MATKPIIQESNTKPVKKLWNFNFFLLWQGQLVSMIGDAVYAIALGFWVLQKTGSTAIMGSLMAASTLPRIIVSPFAGVLVDRSDRKWLLVLMDAVRGIFIVLIAIAAYANFLEVWMVFVAGIIIGLGAAFFNPAVSSSVPDIVPPDKLIKANSAFSMIATGSGIVGNAAGGVLFQILGAPLMFLINGLSYIFSAITEIFIKIPKIHHAMPEFHFFTDLKEGFKFVWQYRGIRYLIISAAFLNFFAVMGIMLFLPLFNNTPHLGPALYGILMAVTTGGMFAGYLLTSIIHFNYSQRFKIFVGCSIVSMTAAILLPVWLYFPLMVGLGIILGISNAVLNSFIMATFSAAVPQNMRGKIFSLIGTIAGGLMPIAFALGGVLAEFIPIRILISSAFGLTLIVFLILSLNQPIKHLINFNPEADRIESFQ
jgi:DHA3 family macrolide efflux protein-like MFS transporter